MPKLDAFVAAGFAPRARNEEEIRALQFRADQVCAHKKTQIALAKLDRKIDEAIDKSKVLGQAVLESLATTGRSEDVRLRAALALRDGPHNKQS